MISKSKSLHGCFVVLLALALLYPGSGLAATFNVAVSSYVNQNTLVIHANAWSSYLPVNSIFLRVYRDGSFLESASSSSGSTSVALYNYSDARLLANGAHEIEAMANFYPTSGGSFTLTDDTTVNINFPPTVTITDPGLVSGDFDIEGTATFKPVMTGSDLGTLYVAVNNPHPGPTVGFNHTYQAESVNWSWSGLSGSLLNESDLPLTIYARARAITGAWSEVVFFTVSGPPVTEKNLGQDCPTQAGNPINFVLGNKFQREKDLTLSGPGLPLELSRYYNSQSDDQGRFGYGWTDSFSLRLVPDTDRIVLYQTDGRAVHFVHDDNVLMSGTAAPGMYYSETGVLRTIEDLGTGYLLQEPDGRTLSFDTEGRLTQIADPNGNTQTLTYDTNTPPRLTSVTDNLGRVIQYAYNANNLVSSLTTPAGSFTYSYDANGNPDTVTYPDTTTRSYLHEDANDIHNLTGIIDENGDRAATFAYDAQDRAVSSQGFEGQGRVELSFTGDLAREVTGADDQVTIYDLYVKRGVGAVEASTGPGCGTCPTSGGIANTFNKRLWVTSSTDAEGTITNYTYDDRGNTLTMTEASGTAQERTTTYTYDSTYNWVMTISRTSVAGAAEALTTFTRDGAGNILTRTESGGSMVQGALSAVTTYTYDGLGRLTSIDGPRTEVSDVTTIEYYADNSSEGLNRGQLKKVTNALSQETLYSGYNGFGRPGAVTDANGVAASLTYDGAGRLTARTVLSKITVYEYDDAGRLTAVELPGGRRLVLTYTGAGLLSRVTDGLGNYLAYTYDLSGRRIGEENHDPAHTLTRTLSYEYDARGRLNRILYPDTFDENLVYSDEGELTSYSDAGDRITSYGYDALHRRTSALYPDIGTTTYQYNAHDHQVGVIDPISLSTTYVYDDLGRLSRVVSPASGQTEYTYDPVGNVLTATDGAGRVGTYTHDALNRVTGITYADTSQNVTYTYDQGTYGVGRLTGTSDASGSVSYTYDGWGRMVREDRTVLGVVYTTEYEYNDNHDLTAITYPSGRTVTYQYDAAGRVTGVETTNGGPPVTLASGGTYRPFGPLSSLTLGNGVAMTRSFDLRYRMTSRDFTGSNYLTVAMSERLPQVYAYDAMNRLTSAEGTQGQSAYTYDTAGNRLTRTLGAESDTYTYDSVTGRLQSVSGTNATTLAYDASGRTTGLGTLTLAYNDRGRLAQVSNTGGTLGQYSYNALEQRVIKTADGATTVFHYDREGRLIAESASDGTIQREYIHFNDEPLALLINGSAYYFANDHLGSGQALFNQAGQTVWQAQYDPFGAATISPDSTLVNNLRLPGQYFDSETGLHYNWHRYYEPGLGRYLTPDPIGFEGGINLYVYGASNPINSIDPDGQVPWVLPILCAGGGCEAVAGAITGIGIGLGIGVLWNESTDNDGCDDLERVCQERYDSDVASCRNIGKRRGKAAAARCYKAAADRLAACLRNQPLPPLDVWNN
jgi:RHS repeat-associated protein